MKYLFPVCALLSVASVACTGILDGSGSGEEPSTDSPNPGQPDKPSTSGGGSGPATPGAVEPAGAPFKVRNVEPELVPFQMRIRRIAAAVGVQVDNPMFANMTKNRLKLGDYDYANGALPDGSWNANRISAWITALKPICSSPEMKAAYPALPADLPKLIRASWGHLPSAEDSADFTTAVAASTSDDAVKYESTCMAVFSAAEFVYR